MTTIGHTEQSGLGFLMQQTLFGESMGIKALKKLSYLLQKHDPEFLNSKLSTQLNKQIADEARHAAIYRSILKSGQYGTNHEVSFEWKSIIEHLDRQDSPFSIVSIIHLLIEPFTKAVVEDLIVIGLQGSHIQQVKSILEDEAEHINLGSELIEFCQNHNLSSVNEFRSQARFFMKTQGRGIMDKISGHKYFMSKSARLQFLEEVSNTEHSLLKD